MIFTQDFPRRCQSELSPKMNIERNASSSSRPAGVGFDVIITLNTPCVRVHIRPLLVARVNGIPRTMYVLVLMILVLGTYCSSCVMLPQLEQLVSCWPPPVFVIHHQHLDCYVIGSFNVPLSVDTSFCVC